MTERQISNEESSGQYERFGREASETLGYVFPGCSSLARPEIRDVTVHLRFKSEPDVLSRDLNVRPVAQLVDAALPVDDSALFV